MTHVCRRSVIEPVARVRRGRSNDREPRIQQSDLIALGALLVAALTARWTLSLQRAVWKLQRRKLEREEAALQRARLRIRCDLTPNRDVLYIENIGGGTAREPPPVASPESERR